MVYWAPVATATFSPKGSWGDLTSNRSFGEKVSATEARVGPGVPVDPFSETLRGKSVVVEFDDLQMMCINKSVIWVSMQKPTVVVYLERQVRHCSTFQDPCVPS